MTKKYPKYKDSGIEWLGEIPNHWDAVKLKMITQFLYGNSLSNENRIEGEVPVYGSNGITGYHNQAITDAPCIIIGRKGSFGKVNYSEVPCFPIDTTYYIDKTATNNSIRWIYYDLQILGLDSISKDSAVPGLGREDAYAKTSFLIPLEEQQAIADFLDKKTALIDGLIEKKKRQIELLKEQRQAVINQAVTKGLNPNAEMKDSGIEWLGKIPKHWEMKRLKYISRVEMSNVDKKSYDGEQKIRLCNYTDVYYNEYITHNLDFMEATASSEQISKFILKQGDVLITKDSEDWKDIAVPAYITEDLDETLCGYHLAHIKPLAIAVDGKYIFRSFCAKTINEQFRISANGITRYGLGKYYIENSLFLLPPKNEQADIIEHIEKELVFIKSTINKAEKQIELLKEYRTALISEAVTGKIDVRD